MTHDGDACHGGIGYCNQTLQSIQDKASFSMKQREPLIVFKHTSDSH